MDQTIKPRARIVMQAVDAPAKPTAFSSSSSTGEAEDDSQVSLGVLSSKLNKSVDYVTQRNDKSE